MRAGKLIPFTLHVKYNIPTKLFEENPFRYFLTFHVGLDVDENEQDLCVCDRSGNIIGLTIPYDTTFGISEDMGSSCEIHLIGERDAGMAADIVIMGYYCLEQAKIGIKGK